MMSSAQFPTLVMIIRHGEKPGDPSNDKDGGPDLSVSGSARAAAIPSLFTPDPTAPVSNLQQLACDLTTDDTGQFSGRYSSSTLPAGSSRFRPPTFLFATAPSSSDRPLETITPLAQALQFYQNNPNLTINDNFTDDTDPQSKNGVYALAAEILQNPDKYAEEIILICWHHGTIPLLVERFGASGLPWKKWPPTIFDLVLSISWDSGSANLSVGYQQLLYGDTATTASLTNSKSN